MNAHQRAYIAAKAQYDVISAEYAASDRIFDAAYESAGEPDDFKAFYASWAAQNPAQAADAQRLNAEQNAALVVLESATDALLAWCLAGALAAAKTDEDRDAVRFVIGSKRPHVREKAIGLAMRLAA